MEALAVLAKRGDQSAEATVALSQDEDELMRLAAMKALTQLAEPGNQLAIDAAVARSKDCACFPQVQRCMSSATLRQVFFLCFPLSTFDYLLFSVVYFRFGELCT